MKTYIKVGDEYIVAYDSEAVANAKEATLKALEEVKVKIEEICECQRVKRGAEWANGLASAYEVVVSKITEVAREDD